MAKHIPVESSNFHPFGELIGLEVIAFGQGHCCCCLEVVDKLLNPYQVVHGGVVFSMADTAMGGALYSLLEQDEVCATIETKINFFSPITSGVLTCDAKVIHRSKRLATLEAAVKNDERLVAKALGTFSITSVK